jgi:hypothetical protein
MEVVLFAFSLFVIVVGPGYSSLIIDTTRTYLLVSVGIVTGLIYSIIGIWLF